MDEWKIVIIALILMPLVQATADISVETAYTNPYPVEPGDNVVLGIEVSNNGVDDANNVEITIVPRYPFTLLEDSTQQITTLNSGGVRIIEYDLFVDTSAVSTMYQVPVKIKFAGSNEVTRNINIRVQGRPNLGFIEIPSFIITPGDTKSMRVKIKNLGTGTAKRVVATLESSTENIKTILSGGNVYVGDIQPDETKEATFQLYADSDASYGVYNSFLKLTYEDESGNVLNKTFNLGILINGKPDLRIIKVKTDSTKKELSVDIINQGNSEARGIKGELILGGAIIDVDYISKLNPDKSATLKYDIPVTKNNSIVMKLTYKGPDNEEYERIETIKWNQVNRSPSWLTIFIVLVLGYIIIKKEIYKKPLHLFKREIKK